MPMLAPVRRAPILLPLVLALATLTALAQEQKDEAEKHTFKVKLPFVAGEQYRVSQGNNGRFSHNCDEFRYAWDFDLPEGTPVAAAMALVGIFAIFHGHAHGAELPEDASGLSYAAGFVVATAALHGVGLVLAAQIARYAPRLARFAGGAMAVAGIAFLAG